MNNVSGFISLMTRLARGHLFDDGQQSWLKRTVGIVTALAIASQGNLLVPSALHRRMALQAKSRDIVYEVIFKIRAVGVVAVVTAFLRRGMIVPGIHYPWVTVQTDKYNRRSRRVGIMAALAFRVSHRCVLIFGLDDAHVARCAGGSLSSLCE